MFVDNKYRRWHNQIIDRARGRVLQEKTERHHILPCSLGGGNEKTNLVRLTYREHYLIHWLLVKFTVGVAKMKMAHALDNMAGRPVKGRPIKSWQVALGRKTASMAMIGNKRGIGNKGSTGIVRDEAYKVAMRESILNSEKQRAHLVSWNDRRRGKFMSPAHKVQWAQMIEVKRGVKRPVEVIDALCAGRDAYFAQPENRAWQLAHLKRLEIKNAAKRLDIRWGLMG